MDIIKIIKQDIENKKGKYQGESYYSYDMGETTKYKDIVDQNGNIVTLEQNYNKLYTNYFKMLIDQKQDYLLAKEPTTKFKRIDSVSLMDLIDDIVFYSSLDGVCWIHIYTKDNELKYLIVRDIEIIPFFNPDKTLKALIRYYFEEDLIKVEVWGDTGVRKLTIDKDKIVSDYVEGHYKEIEIYNDEIMSQWNQNFKTIPFIQFKNNRVGESDLVAIKSLLDCYNDLTNGLIVNIDKFQEMLMKLKGFLGDEESLSEAMKLLKKHKAVGVPDGADVEYMSIEIPVEARKLVFDLLERNIYKLGRGVNPDSLGDGNITNIVIKSRYAGLDMKANQAERCFKLGFYRLVNFINEFHKENNDYEIIFNRSMIFNQSELIMDCVNSMALLSLETILGNHPWVTDVKKELKKIETSYKKDKEESKESENNIDKDDLPTDNKEKES